MLRFPHRFPLPLCRLYALLAVFTLLAACAPLEWQKTGTADPGDLEKDQALCLNKARLEARQRMQLKPPSVPQVVVGQQGRTVITHNELPDSERFFLEQNLLRQCMTEKGYTLQPAEPSLPTK